MSSMKKLDQRGSLASILVIIGLALSLLGALGFGYWAYAERADYKDNVDQKIATAVEAAQNETSVAKDAEFVEKEKLPLRDYQGPAAYGSVLIKYPKTWSAYVDEKSGSPVLDGYFHPTTVPGSASGTLIALRVQVLASSYDQELKQFDSLAKNGKVRVSAYSLPLVPGTTGARIDGEIISKKQGSMILLPMRDKTLKIWTEAEQYVGDFNNNILANITFTP